MNTLLTDQSISGFITGGGTRSITRALETLDQYAKLHDVDQPVMLTANPHFAVERGKDKFDFKVDRSLFDNGILSPTKLKAALEKDTNHQVIAVWAQALSYTEGTSDPLTDIHTIIETENQARKKIGALLITLVCDACLGFSAVMHNPSLRILDRTGITPCMVTHDPHKHLGTDKGLSVLLGTNGILDHMNDSIQVGAEPSTEAVQRGINNITAMGYSGYYVQYIALNHAIESAIDTLKAAGVPLLYEANRLPGSTIIAAADPFGAVAARLQSNHNLSTMPLFNLPGPVKTGWQLSVTPHHLRKINEHDGASPTHLKHFTECVIQEFKALKDERLYQAGTAMGLSNHTLPTLYFGGLNPVIFSYLPESNSALHSVAHTLVKRHMTGQLDSQ